MSKELRVISIGIRLVSQGIVVCETLETDTALFDFHVVVIRPPSFRGLQAAQSGIYQRWHSAMERKRNELVPFFAQGGVLVVFLDVPDFYSISKSTGRGSITQTVNNYEFVDDKMAYCLQKGSGQQVEYSDSTEPFVSVLKKSSVAWTAYLTRVPDSHLRALKFFAHAGAAGNLGGKMPYQEGHIIVLPNVSKLDEESFLNVCAEYRFKRQGTTPPEWESKVVMPGLLEIEAAIADVDKQIAELQKARQRVQEQMEERASYRKLLYEKGKVQLEPIVLRALDDLEFGTSPSEIIQGTQYEIDGRTTKGSIPGIIETKGSKNVIAQSEFSPFMTKILADSDVSNIFSKGILVGNGLCETEPGSRLGDQVFSSHVLQGAKRHSVALINSVELYWLCCALFRADAVDKNAVRETILTTNGYVDLKPFSGKSPF